MSSNVLITGAGGQLGRELEKLMPQAIFATADVLDITDAKAVKEFVENQNIDAIINCAAYTAVDRAEDEAELAKKVNEDGARNLALTGAKIIHISTDYIFNGRNYKPYLPEDETEPLSVYGRTKRAGELAVLENAREAVVIRTAWLYSSFGSNFVKTMLKLGGERESLNVVMDQIGTPTFAGDLAQAILYILPQVNEANRGIYHYSNEGVCSWYDFAVAIMALSGLECKVNPIPSTAYPTKAKRPFYSVLSKEKIKNVFNLKIPYWRESLEKCLKQF